MTIAAGFRFDRGILVCADTQFSGQAVKFNESKLSLGIAIRPEIDEVSVRSIIAMSGTDGHMQSAVSKCERALAEIKPKHLSKAVIRDVLEDALVKFYEKHMYKHKFYQMEGGPHVSLIIGTWWKGGEPTIFWSQETTVNEIQDFKCVGHGGEMARYVISPLLPHPYFRPLKDVLLVAIHGLQQTKKADPYCGGESEFGVILSDGHWKMESGFDISQGEAFSKTFQEILSNLFFASADLDLSDEKVKEAMHLLELSVGNIRAEQKEHKERREGLLHMLTRGSSLEQK